jgi:hypothetical protein
MHITTSYKFKLFSAACWQNRNAMLDTTCCTEAHAPRAFLQSTAAFRELCTCALAAASCMLF